MSAPKCLPVCAKDGCIGADAGCPRDAYHKGQNECDRVHMSYADKGVINYAKALRKTVRRGHAEDITAAMRRLTMALDRLADEERREAVREAGRRTWLSPRS